MLSKPVVLPSPIFLISWTFFAASSFSFSQQNKVFFLCKNYIFFWGEGKASASRKTRLEIWGKSSGGVVEEEEEDEIATQPRGRCFIVSYVLGTKSSLNRLLISLLLSCCSIFGHVKVGKHSASLAKDAKVQLSFVEIYGKLLLLPFGAFLLKELWTVCNNSTF